MTYMLYIPDKKLMLITKHDSPGYALLKLRRDCYRHLNYNMYKRNITIRAIMENGGLSKVYFIMSNSIPFAWSSDPHFISYSGDIKAEQWLQNHPGKSIIPIIDDTEYNFVTEHRHDLDNAPDMYP